MLPFALAVLVVVVGYKFGRLEWVEHVFGG